MTTTTQKPATASISETVIETKSSRFPTLLSFYNVLMEALRPVYYIAREEPHEYDGGPEAQAWDLRFTAADNTHVLRDHWNPSGDPVAERDFRAVVANLAAVQAVAWDYLERQVISLPGEDRTPVLDVARTLIANEYERIRERWEEIRREDR